MAIVDTVPVGPPRAGALRERRGEPHAPLRPARPPLPLQGPLTSRRPLHPNPHIHTTIDQSPRHAKAKWVWKIPQRSCGSSILT